MKSLWVKSLVENRGRWDAGFRSPLLLLQLAAPLAIGTQAMSEVSQLDNEKRNAMQQLCPGDPVDDLDDDGPWVFSN